MRNVSLLFALLISIGIWAQPPGRFYGRYGGTGEDNGYSAKPTLDKQYIVAGSSSSYGTHGSTDVYLTKIDSMGFPMWERFYGGQGNEVGKSVILLPDSGFAIAGFTDSYGAGGFDAFIIRVDKDGNQLWQRTFGGTDWDFASDLVQAIDGGIFVVGNTYSFGSGKKDGFVIKYDMSGNLLLQKFIGGAENDELRSIIITNDLKLAAVGYTESRGEINGDGYFVKLDLNGDTLFTRTFGGSGKDYATDLVQKGATENYDYVICGARTSLFPDKTNSYMYRISPGGNFVFESDNYNSSTDEHWESLANSLRTANLTAFLRTIPVPNFSQQGNIMVKYPNGYEILINSFGGDLDETFYSIEGTNDGGYLIVGSTISLGSIGNDVFLIKMDSTCYNYTSVVGIVENNIQNKASTSVYNRRDKIYHFGFPQGNVPENVQILGLDGRLIWESKDLSESFEANLDFIVDGVYLLRSDFKNGTHSHQKMIIEWR